MTSLRAAQRPLLLLLTIALVLVALAQTATASSGDREPGYQHCLQTCKAKKCVDGVPSLSPILRATFWTCEADCAYQCTHSFTSSQPPTQPVQQFYGKWPFWRVLGIQEPASVVFSLGNGWVHYQAIKQIHWKISDNNPLKPWLYALAIIQLNTWLWSAVFHTRDVRWTERMDYFAATMTIMYTLHYSINRLFHLYPTRRERSALPVTRSQVALTLCFAILYLSHISYLLSTPSFDYGYNVAFNVALGAIHLSLWTLFSLVFTTRLPFPFSLMPTPYPPLDPLAIAPKPTYHWSSGALVLATSASMSLELFDFPPLGRVIDAHSLWHAATILLANGWYKFLIRDVNMMWSIRSGEHRSESTEKGGMLD